MSVLAVALVLALVAGRRRRGVGSMRLGVWLRCPGMVGGWIVVPGAIRWRRGMIIGRRTGIRLSNRCVVLRRRVISGTGLRWWGGTELPGRLNPVVGVIWLSRSLILGRPGLIMLGWCGSRLIPGRWRGRGDIDGSWLLVLRHAGRGPVEILIWTLIDILMRVLPGIHLVGS